MATEAFEDTTKSWFIIWMGAALHIQLYIPETIWIGKKILKMQKNHASKLLPASLCLRELQEW